MVLFAFFCDIIGYFWKQNYLFEVGFWNMIVASITIFLAVIFGQFEAGLAQPYQAAQQTLNIHTLTGWILSAIVVGITAWRLGIRHHNFLKIPPIYLGVATFLVILICFQTYLGTKLVWVYGLHVEPVVEAMKEGVIQ